MKQDILCIKCAEERRGLFPTDNPFPGEHIKFVFGTAKIECLCDGCVKYKEIHTGERCCAFSLWTDFGGVPYHQWERNFINPENGKEPKDQIQGISNTSE